MSTTAQRLTRALVAAVVAALLLTGAMAGLALTNSAMGTSQGDVLSQTEKGPAAEAVRLAEHCTDPDWGC